MDKAYKLEIKQGKHKITRLESPKPCNQQLDLPGFSHLIGIKEATGATTLKTRYVWNNFVGVLADGGEYTC